MSQLAGSGADGMEADVTETEKGLSSASAQVAAPSPALPGDCQGNAAKKPVPAPC